MLMIKKEECCGCQLCLNVCLFDSIKMKPDDEGFLYPVINEYTCMKCHACELACPALNGNKPKNDITQKVYACWNNEPAKRLISTSGGVVSALSEAIIEEGGCVVGAYYKDDFTVAHMIGMSKDDIDLLRQSKYMQSDIGYIYKEVEKILATGRKVLFCGTPCHNAALKNILKIIPDNLYQCDFICRGVVSPAIFKEYLCYLERKYRSKAVRVQFKNKDYGWNRFSTKIWFQNGKEYIKDRYHDPYMVSYLRYSVSLRPSCYDCKYKGTDRYSDLTVGDFWGIGEKNPVLDDNKGTSLVIINTAKGQNLFDTIRPYIWSEECDITDIPGGNMCFTQSPKKGELRELYFRDLGKKSFGYIYYRYVFMRKWNTFLRKVGLKH